ncbi:hypothetical protein NQZ68_025332 [Dissostichus eleginoides]|nr:hypothetical protein NQZ68_025332 [Dissostichus eleginoides]
MEKQSSTINPPIVFVSPPLTLVFARSNCCGLITSNSPEEMTRGHIQQAVEQREGEAEGPGGTAAPADGAAAVHSGKTNSAVFVSSGQSWCCEAARRTLRKDT